MSAKRVDDAKLGLRLVAAIRIDERRIRMVPGFAKHNRGECGCDPDNGAWCGWYMRVKASDLDSEYLLALTAAREAIADEMDAERAP